MTFAVLPASAAYHDHATWSCLWRLSGKKGHRCAVSADATVSACSAALCCPMLPLSEDDQKALSLNLLGTGHQLSDSHPQVWEIELWSMDDLLTAPLLSLLPTGRTNIRIWCAGSNPHAVHHCCFALPFILLQCIHAGGRRLHRNSAPQPSGTVHSQCQYRRFECCHAGGAAGVLRAGMQLEGGDSSSREFRVVC
jgi:hypothetical protein